MRLIKSVNVEIVIHSWLRDEYSNVFNFKALTESNLDIIVTPNFESEFENMERFKLLKSIRGQILEEIPFDTSWYEIDIMQSDIYRIYHIPHFSWNIISNGTYHILETVKNINFHNEHGCKIASIVSTLNDKTKINNLILGGSSQSSKLTVFEGNHRLTSMMYKLGKMTNEIISTKYYFIK